MGRVVEALPHDIVVGQSARPRRFSPNCLRNWPTASRMVKTGLPPIYLLIYNLGRFRDLRKEDDFSFGREDDKPATPGARCSARFSATALPAGFTPLPGATSYATVNRLLDRQSLRDFDLRVLFQMNATDSSSLMDAPDAALLGVHRAILYDGGHTARWRSSAVWPAFRPVARRGAAAVVWQGAKGVGWAE